MLLEDITMADFENGIKKTKILIIPFGTIEEHGSHLPLSTDTIQVYEVVKEAAKRVPAFVAPPLHYGVLTSTRQHPGSIGISPDRKGSDKRHHQVGLCKRLEKIYPDFRSCRKYPYVCTEGDW